MEIDVWGGGWGLPSIDRQCLSVMAFCKFADVPVTFKRTDNPRVSPSGELPVLKDSGKIETNVTKIFEHLCSQSTRVDMNLSRKESADTIAFFALMEEKLLPAILHLWWVDSKSYVDFTRPLYAKMLGLPQSLYYPNKKRNEYLARLECSHSGHQLSELELESLVMKDAKECINLLSFKLGEKDYFFGDKPTSLDAVVFAYLAPLLKAPFPNLILQSHLKACRNLTNHCQRILSQYFPLSPQEQEELRKRSEEEQNRAAEQMEFPHRRRNMFLAGVTVIAVMTAYAYFSGLLQLEFVNVDKDLAESQSGSQVPQITSSADDSEEQK